jgi:geranylgeranyl pyrophosphate synthase
VRHLLGGGKLFRPLLALASARSVSGEAVEALVPYVTPLEFIHTFTLIHDDLPCMDDAELRRGLQTVHRRFDEATAVLAGDALSNLAILVLAERSEGLEPHIALRLIRALARATHLVVEGQMLDLAAEGTEQDIFGLEALQRRKTGALIAAACEVGALLAGASKEQVGELHSIGEQIGLAFQIRDDLLSLEGDEAGMGKTLATDLERAKATFPRLLGITAARDYARKLVESIELRLASLGLAEPQLLAAYARQALTRSS